MTDLKKLAREKAAWIDKRVTDCIAGAPGHRECTLDGEITSIQNVLLSFGEAVLEHAKVQVQEKAKDISKSSQGENSEVI